MKLVLFGIQGSGKSTQGNLLSRQLKLPYLSTGHIFREIAKEKTNLGRYVKETMNAGILIPDEQVIKIVNNYLSRPEYRRGYILDGFPRTIEQAKKFKNNVDKVIYLKLTDREAIWRLVHRQDTGRQDETLSAINKRIELFHKFEKSILQYYYEQEKLVTIDAKNSIKEVNEEILRNIGKQLIKNQVKAWRRKQKSIIAIVGLPGSGKTEAANYYSRKGHLPVISFGKILNDYIDKNNLKHDEKTHRQIREGLRTKHGKEVFAVLNEEKIRQALEKNMIIIIDGMRSWEEYLYLKKKFPNVNIYILAIFADKETRYDRSAKRAFRKHLFGEVRDINELTGTNMGPTIAFADFTIKNNFSLDEFYDKLEEAYRIVYFS